MPTRPGVDRWARRDLVITATAANGEAIKVTVEPAPAALEVEYVAGIRAWCDP